MSSIRLFVLGALAENGATHGYDLRKLAEIKHLQTWTDVGIGGLYGTLTRLAAEEFIREVRQERSGTRPERRIFEITPAGRAELIALREQTISEFRLQPDPVDIAYTWPNNTEGFDLAAALAARRDGVLREIEAREQRMIDQRAVLSARDLDTMRHSLHRVRAELAWLDELRGEASDVQGVWAAEEMLMRSETRHVPDVLSRLLAPEFHEIGQSGRHWSRAEIIEELTSAAPSDERFMVDQRRADQLGNGVVLLTYSHEFAGAISRRSSLWRSTGDIHQLVFHQGTPV